jgi:hypothetical protein
MSSIADRNCRLIGAYLSGGTCRSVALEFGIAHQNVFTILKKAGVSTARERVCAQKREKTLERVLQQTGFIISEYRSGVSIVKIAAAIPCDPSHGRKILFDTKVRVKGQSSRRGHHGEKVSRAIRLFEKNCSVQDVSEEIGISYLYAWIIRYKYVEKSKSRKLLSYPHIDLPTKENANLLSVNKIVPREFPDRDDVCQEIMLAILEGHITIEDVKNNKTRIRPFITKVRRDNSEQSGYAVSLDVPIGGDDGRSWHDVLSDDYSIRG